MDASRPETSTLIRDSRQAVNDVSESQDDYCDASVHVDLVMGAFANLLPSKSLLIDYSVWCFPAIWNAPSSLVSPRCVRDGASTISETNGVLDVSHPNDFLRDKMEICVRFARDVLIPICQVFLVSPWLSSPISLIAENFESSWDQRWSTFSGIMKARRLRSIEAAQFFVTRAYYNIVWEAATNVSYHRRYFGAWRKYDG